MTTTFVLVHSPLAGPATWWAVAEHLEVGGNIAVVPELRSPVGVAGTYYERHIAAVVEAVGRRDMGGGPLVLVGHSGAGPLLPLIGAALRPRVACYVFVDAALPHPGKSRLDGFGDPAGMAAFRAGAKDGVVPLWPDAVLEPLIPDTDVRARFVADAQPMALQVYEEPLPGAPGWPEAPCAYLRFSDAYLREYVEAMRRGWLVRQWQAGHFDMLVEPARVAQTLVEMSAV
jgi:pimeloyl-ACP methyl ester carboxylesterase